jgi:dienelactone hydrolase
MIQRWRAAIFCGLLAQGAALAQTGSGLLHDFVVPDRASPPYPVVVLLHGCNGIDANVPMWQQFLATQGYASVVVDSFRRRNIQEICTDFRRLPMPERVNDAYTALNELTQRPDVDAQRVAVMGFSNGAVATLSALTSTVTVQLPKTHARFRGGIAVYPECGPYAYATFTQPILVLAGESDDWTPAAPCLALSQKLAQRQPKFETLVYPNAHHGFDIPGLAYRYLGNVANFNKRNGYGATVEGNDKARLQATQDVAIFLAQVLKASGQPPPPAPSQ